MRSILIAILLAAVMTTSARSAVVEGNVPLVRLLATPERYDGKAITVSGVLHRGEDGVLALYLDPSSAEAGVTGNAIVLLVSMPQPAQVSEEQVLEGLGKYVLVAATFDAGPPRPRGYSGRLQAVELVRPYPLLQPLPNE